MGLETAIIGGAVLGAGGSMLASNKAASAAKGAAETQAAAADRAANLQNAMFQQQQGYLAPYRQSGYTAAPLLEYLTTGIMPTLSPQELSDLTRLQSMQAGTYAPPSSAAQPTGTGQQQQQVYTNWPDRINALYSGKLGQAPAGGQVGGMQQATSNMQGLSIEDQTRLEQLLGKQRAIQAAQGGLQGLIENNPMYQYQQSIGEKNLNRQLAARGRSNSTFGINALGEQNRALLAGESQNLYNRIANLSNVGMGIGAQLGQNAMTAGQNIGGLYQNAGNAIAQGQLGAGQQQASLYSNLGALPMQAYGNYQLANALQGGGNAMAVSPFISASNPLGLTAGQGL